MNKLKTTEQFHRQNYSFWMNMKLILTCGNDSKTDSTCKIYKIVQMFIKLTSFITVNPTNFCEEEEDNENFYTALTNASTSSAQRIFCNKFVKAIPYVINTLWQHHYKLKNGKLVNLLKQFSYSNISQQSIKISTIGAAKSVHNSFIWILAISHHTISNT